MSWIVEIKERDASDEMVEAHLVHISKGFEFSEPVYVSKEELPENLHNDFDHGMKITVEATSDNFSNFEINEEFSVLKYDGESNFNHVNGVVYIFDAETSKVLRSKGVKGRVKNGQE